MLSLEVWKADSKRNLVVLAFLYDFEGNFVCQHFCSFGAMLFNVNLLIKTDSTVICVNGMLQHFYMSHFLLKIADLEDILC